MRLRLQVLELSEAESGGCKQASAAISGSNVYAHLKFESGVHRVQRVPVTESSGRVHTSAASVAVLPQAGTVCNHDASPDVLCGFQRARLWHKHCCGGGAASSTAGHVQHLPLCIRLCGEVLQHVPLTK